MDSKIERQDTLNRLQQAIVWLRRIGHCRGFGIQSPSDYRFVRYVVNEHWPYYAYAGLGKCDSWLRRKKGRLFFRLANDLQPDSIADLLGYEEYLKAGCCKAALSSQVTPSSAPRLLLVPASADMQAVCKACDEQTALVVDDIGRHTRAWKEVLANEKVTVTFDLYYCGIAFFDPQRTPKHYKVNF